MSSSILLIREVQSIVSFSVCAKVLQTTWRSQRSSLKFLGCRALHVDSAPTVPQLTTSYVHGTSSVSLLSQTVGQALQNSAERWPDREAVVFLQDGVRKTFAQLQQDHEVIGLDKDQSGMTEDYIALVDQAAAGLLALGLKRGDRFGMWGPNIYEWIVFQFASAKAGIILVPLSAAYQPHELEYTLRKVQCSALVCPTKFKSQNYCDMLRQICPEVETATPGGLKSARLPDLRVVIVTDSRQPGMFHMDDVMQAAGSQHRQELDDLQRKLSFDDPVNILFTSGTTGTPKAATLSHHNILNTANHVGMRLGYTWRPQVRVCLPIPLHHVFGLMGGTMIMVVHGITLVSPSAGYDGRANLEAIQKERCSFFYGTPTMFIDMLGQPELNKFDLSSLKAGIMGGSPCPAEVVKKVMATLNIEVLIGYGSTEIGGAAFVGFPLDNMERKSETVGCILPHTEAKVVDPSTGVIVPLGVLGELMIRGYCVMLDYWGDLAKTQECISKDRWYRTGDIARLDEYGYCQIEGRIKDMVIRGGENIYPAEIEQFLHTHPKVHEVQVVGVADERMGEELCACIKLKEGQDCTAEEIKAYCKGQISHFKIPRYVTFVQGYPVTATGKIQKTKLRADMEKSLGI